ncbi:hypothetical protein BASA81_003523 [Batrachochytrium salamandrivorans]|nr:hypothetical protein BASA81_003523 [Batrachochytrium salamandrivorans]
MLAESSNLVASLARHPENKQECHDLLQAALAVIDTPDFSRKVLPGAYHSLMADVNVVHFTVDADGSRIYLVIASKEYPKRVVFELISKLVHQFLAEFAVPSMTCAKNGLNARSKLLFSGLMDEFADLSSKDALLSVTQQLKQTTVKLEQEDNLAPSPSPHQQRDLENQAHDAAAHGPDHSSQSKEKWRQYQTYGLVLAVVLCIILLLVTRLTAGQAPEPTLSPTSL